MPTIAGYKTTEKLFEGSTTAIFKAYQPTTGQKVILKLLKGDHPQNAVLDRFRQEHELISSFDSGYIIKTYGLKTHLNSLVMVLEDCLSEFDSLADAMADRTFTLEQFLQLSVKLTKGLDVVHNNRIIYRDFKPANILISKNYRRIKLIDFNIAARDDSLEHGQRAAQLPEGTLPYLSPEQTGRIEQSVDYRTDFYSLGVTLFQFATGKLPFTGDNPGEIIHAHLARTPPSPSRLDNTVPPAISAIILKLLEKNKSRRYQTCRGILLDLRRCLRDLHEHGTIADFEPGEHDISPTLTLPSQLYHRHEQLQLLSAGFDRAAAGDVEIFFISGLPGVGKSSLVHEFNNRLAQEETYYLHGAFEATVTVTPYATITSSLRQLVRHILTENSIRISRWKTDLRQVADDGYGFLVLRIPELERILNIPVPPAKYDAIADEDCLFRVFHDFLRICCQTGPPLVLFLDDLHHADPASLRLLLYLLTSADLGRLLFIGSYRDAAVEPEKPLPQLLASLSARNKNVRHLQLDNLQETDIQQLLSLALAREEDEVLELAAVCRQKTDGNPFHLRQFIQAMNREGHLFYAPGTQRWEWDRLSIKRSQPTENTANMIMQGIHSLPPATRELLKAASCLGESFSLHFVATLHDSTPAESANTLRHAVEHGCIFTLTDDEESEDCRFRFASVRIRHAVLTLLSPGEQAAVHLRAGSYLLENLREADYHGRLYELADHLNHGLPCAAFPAELLAIARVNLEAGRKAQKSEEFTRAHSYIMAGLRSLPEGSWLNEYPLSLELHTAGCETGFLCGRHDDVKQHFQVVLARVTDIYDRCRAYRTYIKSLKAQSLPGEALSACLEILSLLGLPIPKQPSLLRSLSSLLLSWLRLRRYSQATLLALTEMKERKALAIAGFLYEAATAAYSASPRLLPLLSEQAIRLSLKYGNSLELSVTGYLMYGFLLCSLSGRFIDQGHRFGQLALQLGKRFDCDICQPTYGFNSFISHWKTPIHNTLPPLTGTLKTQFGRGDLESTANAAYSLTFRYFLIGANLDSTQSEIDKQHEFVRQLNQHLPLTRLQILGQAVANLKGKNGDPLVLKGHYFNEEDSLPRCLATGDYTSYCIAAIIKLIHAVLFNDYQLAISHSEQAGRYLASLTASVFIPVYYFYDSLANLAGYDKLNAVEKLKTRLAVSGNQRKMQRWAAHAPENYAHKYSLVEAELQRIQGNTERAMEWYDTAIHQAREHAYLHEEALAYEFAARFYTGRRKSHIARSYLQEARYCYYRWGATAKVLRLDSQEWVSKGRNIIHQPQGASSLSGTFIPGEGASRLDMLTVIRASRILSSEMVLDELLKKMMRIMLESAGAQRGFLIFREKEEWVAKVRGSIYRSSIVTLADAPITSRNIASTAIINYVIHSAKDVVLNDACKERIFAHDSYILQKKPRSILCMPIMYQGDIFCILYLENNLAAGAFPPDRQELLHLLGTQAAISLNNSSLFTELEGTVKLLNSEVDKRRRTQQQLLHAEKLSALGRLSASIAHEFGNPLMGVKYLLDDFYKRKNLDESDRRLVELGLEECERMKNLIRDLQRLNKPSSGKMTGTDVHQLIDNVLLFQKKYFASNRIRLNKQYDHSIPEVEVIVDQITQVLFNLTINAVDAMTTEGGVLTISTRRQEDHLIIEIADTGGGIPDEHQERIFEPFFSTKKEEDGTGLGLSISYGIARHHGGDLSFVSTAGQGATFTLSLPCIPTKDAAHEMISAQAFSGSSTVTGSSSLSNTRHSSPS